jgi:hypothetical protein
LVLKFLLVKRTYYYPLQMILKHTRTQVAPIIYIIAYT